MSSSMKEVAKKAGVSIATVSYVINNKNKVKPETQKKVEEAIRELDYKVNEVARNLRNGDSHTICFIVSNLANYFYISIAGSIEKEIGEDGYHLVYLNSKENKEIEKRNIEIAMQENYAGLIIAPVEENWNKLGALIKNVPCVFIDRKIQHFRRDMILSTNYEGCFEATKRLINYGNKKIAFISARFDRMMEERVRGYEDALTQNNISVCKDLEMFDFEEPLLFSKMNNGTKWDSILDEAINEKKVEAILAGNDIFAFVVANYFKRNNIKNVDFATFDYPFWIDLCPGTIIKAGQNTDKIGEMAAGILLKRLKKEVFPFETFRVPTIIKE